MMELRRPVMVWALAGIWTLLALPASGQTVQLINHNGSSSQFYVGQTWTLNVWGAAHQPVTIWGSHNGVPLGTSPLGTTDGSGFFTLDGEMGAATVGSWVEIVYVAGIAASPTLVFDVLGHPTHPCHPVTSNPLLLAFHSTDYYLSGGYWYSDFGHGDQEGEGHQPDCALVYTQPVGNQHLQAVGITYSSLWDVEVEWADIGGRLLTGEHPKVTWASTLFTGVDVRNGIPFFGGGLTMLTVHRADF